MSTTNTRDSFCSSWPSEAPYPSFGGITTTTCEPTFCPSSASLNPVTTLVVWPEGYPLVQRISELIWLGAVVLWMVLMLKAWRGDLHRLPLAGRLAERIAGR